MKPGLETAIREHLELFDDEGTPKRDVIWAVFRSTVLRLRSEFKIETGSSEKVDIPVTDGQGETLQTCQACGKPMYFYGDTWYHVDGKDVMDCPATQIGADGYDQKAVDVIKNLSMLVRRLCNGLNKHEPGCKMIDQSLAYLRGEGLQGSILREESAVDIPVRDGEK